MRRLTRNGGKAVLSGLDHIPDLGTGVLMRVYAPYGSQNRPLSLISGMGIFGGTGHSHAFLLLLCCFVLFFFLNFSPLTLLLLIIICHYGVKQEQVQPHSKYNSESPLGGSF